MKNDDNEGFLAIFALILLFLVFMLCISSCASAPAPSREFDTEDRQDPGCYATMGGLRGYCNATDVK